jgi:hypothetical protein
MAINFPTSLDSLTNPQATDQMNVVSHADQHANANDAIEALEAKVGVTGVGFNPASSASSASVVLHEDTDNGTNKIAITAPSAIAGDKTITLPDATGTMALLQTVYPIGAVYISVVSTSPATLFGFGTWSAFAAGRTLVGIDAGQTEFDTVEETGGEKTHLLTSGESGVPAHTHPQRTNTMIWADLTDGRLDNSTGSFFGVSASNTQANTAANAASAHNNLQPYIVTYMWKRTA